MSNNVYDNDTFFQNYNKKRTQEIKNGPNILIEIPTIYAMFPDMKNKRVLDLGCGYGNNCKKCIELGASYVLGIDLSTNMIEFAKEHNADLKIEYQILSIDNIERIDDKFDVVISSLAVHYVADYDRLLQNVYNVLSERGYFVYSQIHPIQMCASVEHTFDSNDKLIINNKTYYLFSNYNRENKLNMDWLGTSVTAYHRNFSTIINSIVKNGFQIIEIHEPSPTPRILELNPELINQFDIPYYLFIKMQKTSI